MMNKEGMVCVCIHIHITEYYSIVKKGTKFYHSNMDRPGSNINQTEKKKYCMISLIWGFPGSSDGKGSAYSAGDLASTPGLGRSPGGGPGNPLQYSCLENPTDGGAWWATVHSVAKSQTRLSN